MTTRKSLEGVEELLAAGGHKLTSQRVVILEALRKQRSTVTAQQLFDELHGAYPYLGRATVFRNLDALVEVGLARRFERPGHIYAYTSCSAQHHHHLLCSVCNRSTDIDEAMVAPLLNGLEDRYGFSVEHEALDFYGICASCAGQRRGSRPRHPQ